MNATLETNAAFVSTLIDVVKSYRPKVNSIDTHVLNYFGKTYDDILDEEEETIKRILYGVVRYEKALKIILASFYYNVSTTARNDYTLYKIFAYLSLLELERFGFEKFESLVKSQAELKMFVLLDYIFCIENHEKWTKDELCKVLDIEFVESDIFGRIKKYGPRMSSLLKFVKAKAFNAEEGEEQQRKKIFDKKTTKKTTKPKPFNLHKPRKVKIPEPIRIEQKTQFSRQPPGDEMGITLEQIANRDRTRYESVKEATQAKYRNCEEFNLQSSIRKSSSIRESAREKSDSKTCSREKKRERRIRTQKKVNEPIRMTASAILREDALYRRKQAEQAKIVESYESCLRDASAYHRWQSEMKQKDERERLRLVDERRIEMVQSAVRVKQARARTLRGRLEFATNLKAMSKQQFNEVVEEKRQEVIEKRQRAKKVAEVRDREPQVARDRVLEKRRQCRDVIYDRRRKDEEKIRERQEAEQVEKEDVIRRIRALELVPNRTAKIFDPTKSAGVGLLDEMSLTELYARLKIVKERDDKLLQQRREKIQNQKHRKRLNLESRLRNITRSRLAAKKANRKRRLRDKESRESKERDAVRELEVSKQKLAAVLESRRRELQNERETLKEEEARVRKQRLLLGSNKSSMERSHFEDFEKGRERETRIRQTEAQRRARHLREVTRKDRLVRMKYSASQKRKIEKREAAQRKQIEEARRIMSEAQYKDMQRKKDLVVTVRDWEHDALQNRDARLPYSAHISLVSRGMRDTSKWGEGK